MIRVYLTDDKGDTWPDTVDGLVTTGDDGRFCWVEEYPSVLQVNEEGDAWGTTHPIEPGTYELVAGSGSFDFAHGKVRVLDYRP